MSAAPGRDARVDKAIHVVATSAVSWEDAARVAINEASLTIRDLSTGRVVDVDARLDPGGARSPFNPRNRGPLACSPM